MSELYNRPFKVAFAATILLFTLINWIAYSSAVSRYEEMKSGPIAWAPGPRFPDWGVPFSWEGHSYSFGDAQGLVFNFLSIVATAFLVGLIVRFCALRFR